MYYSTEKQMERLDILAVRNGLEIRQMMELAGWHMISLFKELKLSEKMKVSIIIGKGNKGGDGLCAARHLMNQGYQVTVILLSKKMSPDAEHHLRLLEKMKVKIILYPCHRRQVYQTLRKSDIIIDSLIGYHLKGAPRGLFKGAIELINALEKKVIAYDIPSGMQATTGACLEPTIRASATLTLALPKKAFQAKWAGRVCGKVYLGDIGIPDFLYDRIKRGSRPAFKGGQLIKVL